MYSARQVAELLDLPVHQVREYARAGVLAARRDDRGAYAFGFQDLVVLRTAMRLVASQGLSHRRVRGTLGKLRHQIARRRSLTEVAIASVGGSVVVQDGPAVWEPDSGQLHFNFAGEPAAAPVAPLPPASERPPTDTGKEVAAHGWYEMAIEREPDHPDDAVACYRRAVTAHPGHVDARVRLAQLLQARRDLDGAIEHYRAALKWAPYHATAAFNLGVALEDQHKLSQAAIAYRHALRCDSHFADAHYNLGRLFERLGDPRRAIQHFQAYRRLAPRA